LSSNVAEEESKQKCDKYRRSFLGWVQANPDLSMKILGIDLMPVYPDYGGIMRKGCNGFAKDVMTWPVDMILGGIDAHSNSRFARQEHVVC
jgi:hypothetical protein